MASWTLSTVLSTPGTAARYLAVRVNSSSTLLVLYEWSVMQLSTKADGSWDTETFGSEPALRGSDLAVALKRLHKHSQERFESFPAEEFGGRGDLLQRAGDRGIAGCSAAPYLLWHGASLSQCSDHVFSGVTGGFGD